MDAPPSGWYPDPNGTPNLLRWWDGDSWTAHTYLENGPAEVASTRVQPPVHSSPLTRAEPGMALTVMHPPTGPRTEPQPAIPPGYGSGYGNNTGYGNAGGYQNQGTQILSLDDSEWGGGQGQGPYARPLGFLRDERQRRMAVTAGLTAGVVAAIAVIGFVVAGMRSNARPLAPAAAPAPAHSTSSAPSPSASASPSPSATAPAVSTITDTTSGLSYSQLAAPWGAGCPASLAIAPQVFTWAAGEAATAGQFAANGQPVTWYGDACSGQLPAQYGYNGTPDLANVTNALANAFNAAYYMALPHSYQPTASQPVSISGHPGWEIKFTETYTAPQPGMAWTNEQAAVVVTDPQNGAAPAVFYVSIPGNLNPAQVDTLVSSLQLTPPQPAATPAASAPPASAPAPGGQGGDPGDPGGGG